MGEVIVHSYAAPNLRRLKRRETAKCVTCKLSEKTRLIDGEDGYLCIASLYDIKTLACYVPDYEKEQAYKEKE